MSTAVPQAPPSQSARALARRIRRRALEMTSAARSSHIGSVFSMADIVAVLYASVLRVDPERPDWPDRDRFILSKGHAGAGIYAALAETGFFADEALAEYYADGSRFGGHVSHRGIPGVELSTGSLGHGLGVGCGLAYAARLRRRPSRVFALLSDGECDEGSTWEAAQFAGHHRLGRLTAIVDYNKIQSLKGTEQTLGLEPFAAKWRSFRWQIAEVDGHDPAALSEALSRARAADDRPLCVIAHTVKGKGVSFMENSVLWHYRFAAGEELAAALRELAASE